MCVISVCLLFGVGGGVVWVSYKCVCYVCVCLGVGGGVVCVCCLGWREVLCVCVCV